MDPIIERLADLAARHKLVPFIGAGCSAPHVGVDWDSLIREMAAEIGTSATDNLQVAEEMLALKGDGGLAEFLRKRLLVDQYDDAKGTTHIQMLGLNLGLVYTTNQDNVFEKCAKKYGRPWKAIVEYNDLAEYRPGERLYIKYHGDLEVPSSIVFATSHYEHRRKDRDHFLNIRLRSDLLAKCYRARLLMASWSD